jgi:hypothetical protein
MHDLNRFEIDSLVVPDEMSMAVKEENKSDYGKQNINDLT